MSKKPKPPAGRRGALSDDDTVVWSHTASSIAPLKRRKARVLEAADEAVKMALDAAAPTDSKQPGKPLSKPPPGKHSSGKSSAAKLPGVTLLPVRAKDPPVLPKAPPLADFDRRKARQLAGGQVAIDARLDLHGFRQSEAHAALRNFLFNAYRRGHRWVLIITGKGSRARQRDEDDFSFMPIETGVLKRNLPMWLEDPELRAIVVSHRPAAIKHGGDGALYIHLRNPDKAGR